RTLDAGRGERIPSLDDVVAWAAAGSIHLSVELKQPTPALGLARHDGSPERVVGTLLSAALERCVVHSFDHPTARRVRELWPDATTGVLYGSGTLIDPLVLARSAGASGF